MSLVKNILLVLLTALACYGIFSFYQSWTNTKYVEKVSADVLLERVEKVFKLVTIEGNFSEIYNFENHIFADLWPFRKKALVQVSANVAVGYDFEDITFEIDEDNKVIKIIGALEPKVLSIEHDVKSYDFENGLFNVITDRDITKMGFEAKEFIREKALQSDLLSQADDQKSELIEMLTWILKASGWDLQYEEPPFLN